MRKTGPFTSRSTRKTVRERSFDAWLMEKSTSWAQTGGHSAGHGIAAQRRMTSNSHAIAIITTRSARASDCLKEACDDALQASNLVFCDGPDCTPVRCFPRAPLLRLRI